MYHSFLVHSSIIFIMLYITSLVVVQSLSRVWLFATPWTAACQASLSITNSRSVLKLLSIDSVMSSNHLILYRPFSSCLQSFPASGSFLVSRFFPSSGLSIKASASASVLPMNIQEWCPLGWTGLILLLPKGLSRVFSSTIDHKHQLFGAQPSLWSNSTSIHAAAAKSLSRVRLCTTP